MIFRNKSRNALLASAAAAALLAPLAVEAQQITSAISGTVTTPAGAPAAGATVTVTNTELGFSRTVTTGSNGTFTVSNLPLGSGYTVTFTAEGFGTQSITDIELSGAGTGRLSLTLAEEGSDTFVEEITVSASPEAFTFRALGPGSVFNRDTIRDLPSISRNVNDIIRIDPRVQFEGSGVSCLGANNNFNSFTIDGVRSGDGFGLNGSGNLARNTFPIPFDTVDNVSVEFAPVDVQYGRFSGCQINVTTQRGTNEFHGGAFFLYNNQDLQGDEVDGVDQNFDPFDQYQWGADLGGPIIEDKLFFYGSYEEFSTSTIQNAGPDFLGFARPLDTTVGGNPITQADLDRFANILTSSYGRDPALQNVVTTNPRTNRRFFGRIDWNINDDHRLEATYSRLDELTQEGDGIGNDVFTFQDSFENSGTKSDTYSLRVYSDWTDNFRTDLRVSRISVTDVQNPVGGGEAQLENIPRIAVALNPGFQPNNPFFGQGLTSGPGIFRSANQLDYETDQIRAQGIYTEGDHEFTFGYELESVEVFNLFIVDGTGTIFFNDLDALEAGDAAGFSLNGSFTGDPSDAAAAFTNDIHSLYFQDKWQVSDTLEVIAGLRYEWYDSGDSPRENPVFQQRYGFSNTQSFDGLEVWLPRLGLRWEMPEYFGDTTLTASAGVFSVAGPTVWFANSFQNFGGAIGFGGGFACDDADFQVLQNGQFTGIPQCVRDAAAAQAQGNTGRADAVDPNFTLPTTTRLSLGIEHYTDSSIGFFDGWTVTADFVYSIQNDEAEYFDLTLTPLVDENGEIQRTPDGRVIQNAIDPLRAGCNAVFQGAGIGFANVTPECDAGGDDQDILLTNSTNSGRTINATIQLAKEFQLSDKTRLNVRGGYAYSDVTLSNTGQNSTATTGFENTVRLGPNQPITAPATFSNRHAFTLAARFSHEFIEDYETSIGFIFSGREGNPFSYVYDDDTAATFGDSDREARILPYIPTGPNDPLVDFSGMSTEEQAAFFNFLQSSGLSEFAGGIAPRNGFTGPWNTDLDMRIQQELPGFFEQDRFTLFVDFENFLNLIDSGLGVQKIIDNGDVPEGVPFVRGFLNDEQDRYVYTRFFREIGTDNDGNPTNVFNSPGSIWSIQLGIRYDF